MNLSSIASRARRAIRVRGRNVVRQIGVAITMGQLQPSSNATPIAEALGSATRILVVRLDALGDMILTTPLFHELRRMAPNATVTLVCRPAQAPHIIGNPEIDETILLPPSPPTILGAVRDLIAATVLGRRLRVRPFDIAISPRWDLDDGFAAMAAAWSGANRRLGYSEHVNETRTVLNSGYDRLYTDVLDDRESDTKPFARLP